MKSVLATCLFAGTLILANTVAAQGVVRYEGTESLNTRWSWALDTAQRAQSTSGFWVGYSFSRLMCENCYSGTHYDTDWDDIPTLAELVSGTRIDSDFRTIRDAARRTLDELDGDGPVVPKEVALLFEFGPSGQSPSDLEMSNMSLAYDFGARPLIWLGKASDEESITLLKSVYDSAAARDARKGAIWAIGMHDAPELVVPFLSGVLAGDVSIEFRKSAAYGLGNQNHETALRLLRATALTDRDSEVAKAAVYAIGNIDLQDAVDALADILRNAPRVEIQKAALYAIGNVDGADAVAFLKETALSSKSEELAKAAVYALGNALENNDVDPLLDVLQNAESVDVRKAAVYSIGNTEGPSALEALKYVLENESSTEVRKAAVYALGNIDSDEARKMLMALIGDLG